MEEKKRFNFNPNPKPFKPKPYNQTQRKPFAPYGQRPPVKQEPEEEKLYWTAEEWEDWAEDQYLNNPDAQLPEWFIEKMENEESG